MLNNTIVYTNLISNNLSINGMQIYDLSFCMITLHYIEDLIPKITQKNLNTVNF